MDLFLCHPIVTLLSHVREICLDALLLFVADSGFFYEKYTTDFQIRIVGIFM